MARRSNKSDVDPELVRTSSVLARVTFVIMLLVIAYIGVASYAGYKKSQAATDLANQGQDLATQVKAECAKGGDVAKRLGPLCQQAADLEKSPPAQGAQGERGPMGPVGPEGPQGIPGAQGVQGQPGPQGPVGNTGDTGKDGQNGSQGLTGPKGDPGPAGPKGDPGDTGPTGPDGSPGKPPAGWTWTDPVTGISYACTRSNTDDDAPTYHCA